MNERNIKPSSKYAVTDLCLFPLKTESDIIKALEYAEYVPPEYRDEFNNSLSFVTEGNVPNVERKTVDESVVGTEYQWILENILEEENSEMFNEMSEVLSMPSKNDFLLEYKPELTKWFDIRRLPDLEHTLRNMVYKLNIRKFNKYGAFKHLREENFILNKILLEDIKKTKLYEHVFITPNGIYIGINIGKIDMIIYNGNNEYFTIPVWHTKDDTTLNNAYQILIGGGNVIYGTIQINNRDRKKELEIEELVTMQGDFYTIRDKYEKEWSTVGSVHMHIVYMTRLFSLYFHTKDKKEKVMISELFLKIELEVKKTRPSFNLVKYIKDELPYYKVLFSDNVTDFELMNSLIKLRREII